MTPWRRRKERRLLALEEFRTARRLISEDITMLGEQLSELHVDTLTDTLDAAALDDYRHALAGYERAETSLVAAEAAEDVTAVTAVESVIDTARFHRACVLARVKGTELPTRRDPCFFNPQHLPATADLDWTPPGGVARTVAACSTCRDRLTGGEAPDVRLVRVGDRYVPWWAAQHHKGAITAAFGTVAIGAVPRYVRLEADINRASQTTDGGRSF